MNKTKFIIWLPALFGILLLIISQIDVYQFSHQTIKVDTMLSREMPIIRIGLLSSAIIFLSSFYWLVRKRWGMAIQSIISPLIFMLLFTIGVAMGGAYLNAT